MSRFLKYLVTLLIICAAMYAFKKAYDNIVALQPAIAKHYSTDEVE